MNFKLLCEGQKGHNTGQKGLLRDKRDKTGPFRTKGQREHLFGPVFFPGRAWSLATVSNRITLKTVENLHITSYINVTIHLQLQIVLQPFLLVNCYNLWARFLKLNFCDIWAMVFLQSCVIMLVGRLWKAVATIESSVLGFQRKNSSFFCSIKGLLGTLSTGQIYDADVTPLPKKTGNENVVGHVTCKH